MGGASKGRADEADAVAEVEVAVGGVLRKAELGRAAAFGFVAGWTAGGDEGRGGSVEEDEILGVQGGAASPANMLGEGRLGG